MTTERDQVVNDRSRSVAPTFQNALSEAVDSHHLSEPLIGWIKSISECPDHPCLDSSGFSITFTFQATIHCVKMHLHSIFFSYTEIQRDQLEREDYFYETITVAVHDCQPWNVLRSCSTKCRKDLSTCVARLMSISCTMSSAYSIPPSVGLVPVA